MLISNIYIDFISFPPIFYLLPISILVIISNFVKMFVFTINHLCFFEIVVFLLLNFYFINFQIVNHFLFHQVQQIVSIDCFINLFIFIDFFMFLVFIQFIFLCQNSSLLQEFKIIIKDSHFLIKLDFINFITMQFILIVLFILFIIELKLPKSIIEHMQLCN